MTTAPIQPSNVYALIVGIEKYQAGPDYNLNGPAKDALKFADWLLERGVEPEHIYLFLSPSEQNQGVLSDAKDKHLDPLPATHDAIANTIRSKLTSESSRGDLLYVFWGGHGIITKTDITVRRLFFADTDNYTKWNLNINSLVEALSTSVRGQGFAQQILLIDACASAFYSGIAQTSQGIAAGIEFAASAMGDGDSDLAEQFILFASPEYEVATNDDKTGTGHFSEAVLSKLKGQSLLPDMGAIASQIESDFLKQQRTPPSYWLKIGNKQIEAIASSSSANQAMPNSNSIFISYRRSDSHDVVGRIYDRLSKHFGRDVVFKDVDSIPYGVDFRTHIKRAVGKCRVLIAVIGSSWLNAPDEKGKRRIDNPDDWVRVEIEAALGRGISVIPLLVGGSRLPKAGELPETLQQLTYQNAAQARPDPDFHQDLDRLIRRLEEIVGMPELPIQLLINQESPPSLPDSSVSAKKISDSSGKLQVPEELSSEEYNQLCDALLSAFPDQESLTLMVRRTLNERLNRITQGASSYETTINKLVEWAEANGQLQRLMEGSLQRNSRNPKLKALSQHWQMN